MHLAQPPIVPPVRSAALAVAVAKAVPMAALKPHPKKGLSGPNGNYTYIMVVLQHFGGQLATQQRGTNELV